MELFLREFNVSESARVLDVGVTSDTRFRESNFFEKMYPFPSRITCVGTEDAHHLEDCYPGLRYIRVRPGERLPFFDGEFDIAFSNAVVEHTGGRQGQTRFIEEVCRVSRAFFITTPNRWFPVEHHTGLPFLHYLPARHFRAVLRSTRYGFWAEEENLNLLTTRDFASLFPADVTVRVRKVRLAGICSNLVAIGRSGPLPSPKLGEKLKWM